MNSTKFISVFAVIMMVATAGIVVIQFSGIKGKACVHVITVPGFTGAWFYRRTGAFIHAFRYFHSMYVAGHGHTSQCGSGGSKQHL